MSALPQLEPYAFRYAPYIEDLHNFFTYRRLSYGGPRDLASLSERLDAPGTFKDEFRRMIRSIVMREGGIVPRATLLEIVAIAIGGPLIYQSAKEIQKPLARLFDMLNSVLRIPSNLSRTDETYRQPAVVRSFPSTLPAGVALEAKSGLTRSARFRTDPLSDSELPAYPRPMRPSIFHFPTASQTAELPQPEPSFRSLIIAGASAMLLAIVLAFVLFDPHAASAKSPAVTQQAPPTPIVHLSKPTPYGRAFAPTQPPARKHHAKSQPTAATAPAQQESPASAQQ